MLVQAGASDSGIRFAAALAEVVFTDEPCLESGKRYDASPKEKARALGRKDDQVLIMPGIVPIVGGPRKKRPRSFKGYNRIRTLTFKLGPPIVGWDLSLISVRWISTH